MNRLCQYRDALGTPKQGFHSVRLFNVAILDVLGTIAMAAIITKFTQVLTSWSSFGRFTIILLTLLALGEFLHWLFCVPTTVIEILSPSQQ